MARGKRAALSVLCALGLAGALAPAVSSAHAETYNLTLAGASPGGLWSLLGVGIDSAVKAAYPGSTVTYQTSGGGFANVGLLTRKKVELSIVHDAELKIATAGTAPFKAPVTNLRAIAYLYNWAPVHLIVTRSFAEKYGIRSLDDIAKKKPPLRMVVNKRGNVAAQVGMAMFEAMGVTEKDIKSWGGNVIYAASTEQADLILNRRVDMINNSLFVGHRSLRKIDRAIEVVLLQVPESVIGKVSKSVGIQPYTIKAGSYTNQADAVKTLTLGAELVVNASMDERIAHNITKALIENVAKLNEVHKSMRALTTKLMASQTAIPYHPGAVKAYREAGLM